MTNPYTVGPQLELLSRRDNFAAGSAFFGLTLVTLTEALSAADALNRPAVSIAWLVILTFAAYRWLRYNRARDPRASPVRPALTTEEGWWIAAFAAILGITLSLALISAPNAADSASYHMPRVLRWIQDGTLAPFPTYVTRQIWIGPGHELFTLNLVLLAGTDRVANLVEWGAFAASAVIVSLIARELGAARRGQLFAALFALTLPMSITQASGAQVDMFASFWLCCAVALMLRVRRIGLEGTGLSTAVALGAAVGIACLSKATNALYIAPFAIWIVAATARIGFRRLVLLGSAATVVALAVNAGPMLRNERVFGSPLGPRDHVDVVNETFTPGVLVSNVVRNATLHFNAYSPVWNDALYLGVAKLHRALGMDVNDPRSTYKLGRFVIITKREDEGVAGNPIHLLLIISAFGSLLRRRPRSPATILLGCVLAGALIFCLFIKWQLWHARLHLPLFVVSAGAVAVALEQARPRWMRAIAVVLLATAIPALLRNSLRPLVARQPVFTVPYERRLFTDSYGLYDAYTGAADFIAAQKCSKIGLALSPAASEYPFWKLVEHRTKGPFEIRHVGVTNETRKAAGARDAAFRPCAVVAILYWPNEMIPPQPGFQSVWHRGRVTVYMRG
jgi:hypothetical protein